MIYKKHIFICNNQRPEGAIKRSCGDEHGTALVSEFKKILKEKNLQIEIRTQKTGCFDLCDHGPVVVVYPDAIFYKQVELSDVPEIVESHLINDVIVDRLLLSSK
jgi:(2Fe-2S) ferredoxin